MSARLAGARVLLVGGFPPPHGGISVHVQALRDELRSRGAFVHVLDVGRHKAASSELNILPIRGPWALAAQLARHAASGWLIHVHVNGHNTRSWMVALAGALSRRPLGPAPMLTVHSGLLPTWLAQGPAHQRLARRVASAYGWVVAVSPIVARALVEAGVAPGRVVVAPAATGPVVPGEPPLQFEEARATFQPLLACAAAASPIYGLRVLLPALRLLTLRRPSTGAVLFGSLCAAHVEAAAVEHGLAHRVRFLGELDHGAALAVIAGADVFVRPTLADGDALSVREAVALGRPVVASAVGHRPDGVTLFRPGDAAELALRVEEALARPAPNPSPEQGFEAVFSAYEALWAGRRAGSGGREVRLGA
ncbi:MAG: glycosyltransferase family 4 protein [Deltaproteobacteria bacterium]|nr:glycosyltransferase family 4 protein [Deltaproteobacteria bacterium]